MLPLRGADMHAVGRRAPDAPCLIHPQAVRDARRDLEQGTAGGAADCALSAVAALHVLAALHTVGADVAVSHASGLRTAEESAT